MKKPVGAANNRYHFGMPELPEVETVLRAIHPALRGRRFERMEILRRDMVSGQQDAIMNLAGKRIEEVTRHGKYLFMHFQGGETLELHLRMSGRLMMRMADESHFPFERLRFHVDAENILVFSDLRALGRVRVHKNEISTKKKLGPDALSVTEDEFISLFAKKKGILKAALLDQSLIAGIGNIYADELCFEAGIDPRRRMESLNLRECKTLFSAMRKVLLKGIKNRGTSFKDFLTPGGKPGLNQSSLNVYGRKGKPCLKCKMPLASEKIAQRTTVFCRRCQR